MGPEQRDTLDEEDDFIKIKHISRTGPLPSKVWMRQPLPRLQEMRDRALL